ncbi:acyltransferase family protein [Planctomicrobium sp. SH664]|uniref:acyltransferase family protein n=1 Tax=Planctomicrobium sp. SH664 TaxID=3448125 RepID=UPI003F5CB873
MSSATEPGLRKLDRIDSLTSLRFFAAFAVVILHYFHLYEEREASGAVRNWFLQWTPFLRHGELMVDFFFILSGFVLAFVYSSAVQKQSLQYFGFVRKRFARIYPLHLVMLLAFIGVWLATSMFSIRFERADEYTWPRALYNFLMLHSMTGLKRGFNGPSWSISAEWVAYLLFPFVAAFFLSRLRLRSALLVAIGWFLLVYFLVSKPGYAMTDRTGDGGVFRILAELPLGIVAFRIYAMNLQLPRPQLWVAGSILSLTLLMTFDAPTWMSVLVISTIVLFCALAERQNSIAWLRHPWLVYGGEISYSIYMVHSFIQTFLGGLNKALKFPMDTTNSDLVYLLAGVPLVLLVSHFTYRWIEVPARDWILRRKPETSSSTETSAKQASPDAPLVASET